MRLPSWLGGKLKQEPPLHPELPAPTGPLREFVYLDEVSVISLVASRRGAVPEAVTRSETARESAQLTSKIGANAVVAKAEVGSRLAAESTAGVTTIAKSVVQTTFKDLREISDETLTLSVANRGDPPAPRSAEALLDLVGKDKGAGWVLDPGRLQRGAPLEVVVELDTDPLFRVTTALSEGLLLMGDMRELAGVSDQDMAEMQRFSGILTRLLAGLVPLRSRVVDYRLVEIDGRELVVHRGLVEGLDVISRDLTLVGVASRDLFWRDLRSVLFSGAPHTVFGRIGRPGIQRTWNPVKLAAALQEVAPHLDEQLQQVVTHVQSAIRSGTRGEIAAGSREEKLRAALVDYARQVSGFAGESVSVSEVEAAGLLSETQLARHAGPDTWRESFREVDADSRERFGLELTVEQALDLRTSALRTAGLLGDGGADDDAGETAIRPERWLLEVEPVAIYW